MHKSTSFPKTSGRVLELDGIRGLAILSVLIWHYLGNSMVSAPGTVLAYASRLVQTTWTGVDLFLVLSGFLIGGILLDNRQAKNYFKVFYVRRIWRIFPLYFLMLALFIVFSSIVVLPISSEANKWLFTQSIPIWSYFTFTQNILMAIEASFGAAWINVSWSLAVEEQFYLLLPPIIRFVPPKKLPFILIGLILFAPILRLVCVEILALPLAAYTLMPCRADALLLGVLCAWLVRQEQVMEYLIHHTKQMYIGLCVLIFGGCILTIKSPAYNSAIMTSIGYSWFALLYTCFLLIAITEKRGFVKHLTRTSLLRRAGILAYGLYLFHQPLQGLAHGIFLNQAPKISSLADLFVSLIALLLTAIIAQISWSYFEKRFVEIGHRLKYQVIAEQQVSVVASYPAKD